MKDCVASQPTTQCGKTDLLYRGLTTCLADMMVQMKMPADTKAIDRYLLAEYLQRDGEMQITAAKLNMDCLMLPDKEGLR